MKWPLKDKKFIFLLSTIFVAIALEILNIIGIRIPMPYAPFIFAIFILLIGYEVLWNGLKALIRFDFTSINLLMLIACLGAFYLQEYSEAAVVILLYVLGETLEDIGLDNSKSALNELVDKVPKTAFVKEKNDHVLISQIEIGDTITVKPGEMIPMDGKVISGSTSVDESAITGESEAKNKGTGDTVFAGTLNQSGFIEFRTTKRSEDTTFSKIIQLTFEAQAQKGDTQKFIQKFSKIYTPAVLVTAILLFTIPVYLLHQDINHWLLQAVSLLVIACPCALVISTPVAIYAAIGNASGKGALIKGGKYVEALAKIKAVALDKTRTITYGKPVVSDVISFNNTSEEELLACTAGAEIFSEHPLAQAIVKHSRDAGYEPHVAENFQSIISKGATAECLICKDKVSVGSLSYISELEGISEGVTTTVDQLSREGKTSIVTSFGNGIAGVFGLTDAIKPDSSKAIEQLNKMGVNTFILSGDNKNAVEYVGRQVNISKVFGEMLPEQKAEKVKDLMQEYKDVIMVGDGVNDAPALAQSTIGIAMGAAGSDTAIETANIALMNDQLSLIPFLIALGKKTLLQIKVNTIGAIAVKFFFILLAFLGHANLVFAIAADVGVTLVVILLSLRLMNYQPFPIAGKP